MTGFFCNKCGAFIMNEQAFGCKEYLNVLMWSQLLKNL